MYIYHKFINFSLEKQLLLSHGIGNPFSNLINSSVFTLSLFMSKTSDAHINTSVSPEKEINFKVVILL